MAKRERPIEILVADDDLFIRQLFDSFLNKVNCNLRLVGDGETALLEARSALPDIIFLDLIMPNMDGFEALSMLRKDAKFDDVPILIVTSRSDIDTMLQALRYGATDFLAKPFSRSKLLYKIDFLLLPAQRRQIIYDAAFVDEIASEVQDAPTLALARRRFLNYFDHIFIQLIRLIDQQEKEAVKRIAWRVLYGINVFQLTIAKGKLVQMMAAVKKEEWDSVIEHLESVRTYFDDFAKKLPRN